MWYVYPVDVGWLVYNGDWVKLDGPRLVVLSLLAFLEMKQSEID